MFATDRSNWGLYHSFRDASNAATVLPESVTWPPAMPNNIYKKNNCIYDPFALEVIVVYFLMPTQLLEL